VYKLLTTPNNDKSEDEAMFEELGLTGRPANLGYSAGGPSSDGSEFLADSRDHVSDPRIASN